MIRTTAALLGLATVLLLTSCASGNTGGAGATAVRRNPNLLSQEELAEATIASLSLQDAIQRLRPNWLRSRGATSISGGSQYPAVMLNESPQGMEILSSLRSSDVTSVQFLSGADATTLYGTGYVNGLIKITTGGAR